MGAVAKRQDAGAKAIRRRNRDLSPKARKFLELVSDCGNVALACRGADLSESQGRRLMKKPNVIHLLDAMAVQRLALHRGVAANTLVEMCQQRDSKKVAMESAERILAIGNIRPPASNARPAVNVSVGMLPGLVIHTREERTRYREMLDKGVIDVVPGGYLIDCAPDDDEPEQAEHRPNGAEQARRGV